MSEATIKPKAPVKPAAATTPPSTSTETPKFVMPTFDMPKFEIPKMEVPAALREWAEKGVAQAKDGYAKMKTAAEEATGVMETTYATAAKGYTDYNLKVIETARLNTNSAFDYATSLLAVKSLSELVELISTHTRKQVETFSAQAKELSTLAQKVATEASEPIKSGVTKAFHIPG
jgi:phasin